MDVFTGKFWMTQFFDWRDGPSKIGTDDAQKQGTFTASRFI